MVMGTTAIHPMVFYPNKLSKQSTVEMAQPYTTDTASSDLLIPGMWLCTAVNTAINFPIEDAGKELGIYVIVPTVSSAAYYPQIDVMRADKGFPGSAEETHASSAPKNWDRFVSTDVFGEVSSYLAGYTLGLPDLSRYAQNFGGTSSNCIDKWQNFVTVMAGYSSLAIGVPETHAKLTTNAAASYFVGAIQL